MEPNPGTGLSMRHWVYAVRLGEQDEAVARGWVPMRVFPPPQEYPPDTIMEMPCNWKIQEALLGNESWNRILQEKIQDDGATKEALEDAWRYGMSCESATIGGIYTGQWKAKHRMIYGHYFKWAHDGNMMWRVIVDVKEDIIITCYPKGERGSAAHSTDRRQGVRTSR